MHFGPEDDAGVSSQHTQSTAPGESATVERLMKIAQTCGDLTELQDAITEALQASAAAVEPVAWRRQEAGIWVYYETKAWDDLEPLYTAPPLPAQVQAEEDVEPSEIESVIACLGDDAASLRDHPATEEIADNMDRAAELLQELASRTPAPGMAGGVGAEQWLPMETAPTDGTMVRLLVDYSGEDACHPLEDAAPEVPRQTIGANNDSNVGEDEEEGWLFAGWSWEQDCFTQGHGKPIGWLPFAAPHPSPAPQAAGAEKEMIDWLIEKGMLFTFITRDSEGDFTSIRCVGTHNELGVFTEPRTAIRAAIEAGRAGS